MQELKLLYERYKTDIFYYLFSLTHDKSLSEDLLSETFLSALLSLPNFKGNSDVKTWLFSIARHKWYEHLRKKRKTLSFEELADNYFSDLYSLEENADKKELAGRINSILKECPERSQKIMKMRIEGYSYYEIGKETGISESSARVIDFRLKNKIKEILFKEGYEYE